MGQLDQNYVKSHTIHLKLPREISVPREADQVRKLELSQEGTLIFAVCKRSCGEVLRQDLQQKHERLQI